MHELILTQELLVPWLRLAVSKGPFNLRMESEPVSETLFSSF
jgi:hypothetical protein